MTRAHSPDTIPTSADLERAAETVAPFAHRTPVLTCRSLDEMTGGKLFFKCENFQKVGAFKFRGAVNSVFSLPAAAARRRGVITHSSGNHAQALALAARLRGIPATIVMPETAPRIKVEAVRGYGGSVVFCAPTLRAREETAARLIADSGAEFIHPYNDSRVIAGQATCARELFQQVEDLDLVLTPVGGGGLTSGTALAARRLSPRTRVVAAEPEGADDASRSFASGRLLPSENPHTIADGLLTSLGELTFAIIRRHVHDVRTVSEEGIVSAMRLLFERMKLVVEPSAAVPLGLLLENKELATGLRVGIILSGGNVDLARLPWRA
jgi:threonine dehydratase